MDFNAAIQSLLGLRSDGFFGSSPNGWNVPNIDARQTNQLTHSLGTLE
jgi:hypothetical protein